MTNKVPVTYVGKKPHQTDRKFKTGAAWSGRGDVQEVDEPIAHKMVQLYPDQYALGTPDTIPLFAQDEGVEALKALDRKEAETTAQAAARAAETIQRPKPRGGARTPKAAKPSADADSII